ncbi:MAG TPA: LysM peptidoglycan-binding domain-containing protein [Anaerolineales bacterium]|nr:LysM peptidoglycan-binding domain-containing protein [Anaerolineales bacterium]
MNEKFTNDLNREDEKIVQKLNQAAENIHANAQFSAELEKQLRSAPRPKAGLFMASFQQVSPILRWVALMILLALVLSLSIKTLIPGPQPSIDSAAAGTATPATTAIPTETSLPPRDYTVGAGDTCGSIGSAFGVSIQSIITLNNLSSNCLISVGQHLKIPYSTMAPRSATNENATPLTESGGYDWRGAKVFLQQALPETPDQAHVYVLKKDEPATEEEAHALAQRFGIQGEMYTTPSLMYGTNDYVFSDGKQLLQLYSDRYFIYTSDIVKNNRNPNGVPNANIEVILREFLQAHGFDFPFRVSASDLRNGYVVQLLAPDSIPMQYESFTPPVMRVTLDENGEVLSVSANLMAFDPTPLGTYGILTAQEALQKWLDDSSPAGKTEFFYSPGNVSQDWYRDYPDNQLVTIYGNVSSDPAVEPGKPALILINGASAVGNTSGLEKLDDYKFISATGQYIVENGVRRFEVASWNTNIEPSYVSGTLRREGEQIILTSDDGSGNEYALIDPPADLPLDTKIPDSQLAVNGAIVNGKMDWTYIYYYADMARSGGGGGGGGSGFYKLNLSGTQVPFPTATVIPQLQSNQGTVEYTVKEGDTVLSIAESYGITPEKILEANKSLEGGILKVGQTLIIPVVQENSGSTKYTVQANDTLASIAYNFGITVEELMQANGLNEQSVFLGQTLIIPGSDSSEKKVEDLRGFLSIVIHKKADGTEAREYTLSINPDATTPYYPLEGPNLSELDAYNGLPILVSGTIQTVNNLPTLKMESYKIPFPDLHFEILKGTQKAGQLAGQTVVLFATQDGKSYVELMGSTNLPTNAFIGLQGDLIQQEVLIVPDETFGGMPIVRVYQSSIIDSGASPMQITADQPHVIDDTQVPEIPIYTPPNLTLDRVELVYYVSNPYYQVNDPNYSQRSPYIQPAWHFHGHYDSGEEYDVLVQALKQEFLLPEIVPGLGPG